MKQIKKKLLIKKCSDNLNWYANKVGQEVDFICRIPEGYLSREDAGFTNVVLKEDAEIVES